MGICFHKSVKLHSYESKSSLYGICELFDIIIMGICKLYDIMAKPYKDKQPLYGIAEIVFLAIKD